MTVPHVIVKLWPGKSAEQKQRLSDVIANGVKAELGYGDDAVSVAFEEIPPAAWTQRVYEPDILGKWDQLTKRPNYGRTP